MHFGIINYRSICFITSSNQTRYALTLTSRRSAPNENDVRLITN